MSSRTVCDARLQRRFVEGSARPQSPNFASAKHRAKILGQVLHPQICTKLSGAKGIAALDAKINFPRGMGRPQIK
jgi:hypothetical protein